MPYDCDPTPPLSVPHALIGILVASIDKVECDVDQAVTDIGLTESFSD